MYEEYQDLANAIVYQAYMDLRKAYYREAIGSKYKQPGVIKEVHEFLTSDWFQKICTLDPYVIDERARTKARESAEEMKKLRG